jgi:hypothetical protein
MTIEGDRPEGSNAWRAAARFVRGLALVLGLWIVAMAGLARLMPPERVVAFGDPLRLIGSAGATQSQLLDAGRWHVVLAGGPDAVPALYAAGAWLVWPALGGSCRGRV